MCPIALILHEAAPIDDDDIDDENDEEEDAKPAAVAESSPTAVAAEGSGVGDKDETDPAPPRK